MATLIDPTTGQSVEYSRTDLENLGIDMIRKLLRRNFPDEMTGMVGANIKKDEGIPVLLGERPAAEVASEVKVRVTQQPAAVRPAAPSLKPAASGIGNIGAIIQQAVDATTAELTEAFQKERELYDAQIADLTQQLEDAKATASSTPKLVQVSPGQTITIAGTQYPAIGATERVPAADPCFVWEAWKAESRIGPITIRFSANDVLRKLKAGRVIWIDGPSGCGKTTLIEQFAAAVGWPYVRIQGDRSLSPDDLIGTWTAKNGTTEFVYGPLVIAMKIGAILLIDEADKFPPHCTQILHAVLERGATGKLVIPQNGGEVVTPHPNFRIVATSNDLFLENAGQHPDAQAQDFAYVNRFDDIFVATYCAPELEQDILVKQGLDKKLAASWVEFARLTREAYHKGEIETPISTRNLVRLAMDPTASSCFAKALCSSVLNRFGTAERPKILELAQRAIADETLTQSEIN